MNEAAAPFGDCKDAALHHIGNVQANGVLVAVHSDNHLIQYCSANSTGLLGIEPTRLLGRTASQWLPARWPVLLDLASQEGTLASLDFAGSELLAVVGHRCGPHFLFEFERAETSQRHWWTQTKRTRFIEELTAIQTAEQCSDFLVRWVFDLAGYDRVMMFRFLPGWDGEVVRELCRPGINGFLGLRFPASDLPPNARQLFAKNWHRAIADVDAAPVPVLTWNDHAPPLDLTHSILRSAHPVHIQYLKNMGVEASLTLSVVIEGTLWGLVTCHHLTPRALPIGDRLAFEEMARLVSLRLGSLLASTQQFEQLNMRRQLSRLEGAMSTTKDDLRAALSQNLDSVLRMFEAGAAWLRFEEEDFFAGVLPEHPSLAHLGHFLDRFSRDEVSHYDTLPAALQPYPDLSEKASGVLFIPLQTTGFIAVMRPEVIATVDWAGSPEGMDSWSLASPLCPRNSFAAWSQLVRNTAKQWTSADLGLAVELRNNLQLFAEAARINRLNAVVHAVGQLQKTLLGSVVSGKGILIESCFRQREAAGGDFLAHYSLPGGQDVLLVTDVSGHHFDAAVMSSFFHGMARGLLESGCPVEEVLTRYNRVLLTTPGFEARPTSLAVCALSIDYQRNLMTTCLAGAPPPAWIDENGWVETWAGPASSPLGWFLDSQPAIVTGPVPGGPVWIWTDGVDDLAAQIGAHSISVATALIALAKEGSEPAWMSGARDDVLAACVFPRSAPLPPSGYLEPVVYDRYNRTHIPQIDGLQAMWRRSLEIAVPGIGRETALKVLLSSREALLHSLENGCTGEQEVRFQIARMPSLGDIIVRVQHPGDGNLDAGVFDANDLGDGGKALLLIRNLASSVSIENRGAFLTMTFRDEAKQESG